ncbi:MAG: hypothetical protein HY540_02040 [Deltaproteobacteria bacterium]|nr:hypothetical protein [Deltaproteobacteria bacterium]
MMQTATANPIVRKIWWITLIVQSLIGFTNGMYLYTYGPYFYEKFGTAVEPGYAILLMTILLGLRQGILALLEVPTGALADTIGRVNVVIISWIARLVFFSSLAAIWFCTSVAAAFAWGVIASIAFALSYALFNGAFSAWCVETLKEKAPEVNYGWLSSRFFSYRAAAEIIGGLLAICLYLKGLPYWGFLIAALASFAGLNYVMGSMEETSSLSFLNIRQVQISAITRRIGEIIGKSVQVCKQTKVLFWLILSYGAFMFLLNLVGYLWPVYLKAKFGNLETFGRDWILIMITTQLLMVASSRFLAWLNGRWTKTGGVKAHLNGFRKIFFWFTLLSACSILLLSADTAFHFMDKYIFPLAVILLVMSFGFIGPAFETLVNAYIPAESAQYRSTIMSAGSMLRSFLILLFAIPSGGSSGETTPIGWAIPATMLLVACITANHFMRRKK